MSRAWKGGSTTAWRKTRATVLLNNQATNRGMCTLGIEGVCTGTANQVHHTRGKKYGDDIRYLTAVCRECNLHVGDPMRNHVEPEPKSNW